MSEGPGCPSKEFAIFMVCVFVILVMFALLCFALLCFALISNEKRGEMKLREHCLMLRLLDTMLFL